MIRIVPFHPSHFAAMVPLDIHQADNLKRDAIKERAVTFLLDDEPIAILGWDMLLAGVMQVWAILSDRIRVKPLGFHKTVKLLVEHAFEAHQIRRMQMTVKVGYTKGWEWAKSLGFECEGIMRSYGADGSAYWLFSRIA